MTIASGDIKFVASEVMTDDDEGGGAPTSTEIVDGASNSIFPDVQEVDRAGGRFRMRKVFLKVDTGDTDTFGGANVVLAETPEDDAIGITLMTADAYFETRADAVDRVEAYLYRGALFSGYLLENHLKGMKTLQIIQRPGATLPQQGQTLFLVENESDADEYSQYVRIKSVSSETTVMTVSTDSGYIDLTVQLVTVTLTAALSYSFTGSAANRLWQAKSGAALIRSTIVANATKYLGAATTTAAVNIDDNACLVKSVYSRLVLLCHSETF
jgi:hypothetical protein